MRLLFIVQVVLVAHYVSAMEKPSFVVSEITQSVEPERAVYVETNNYGNTVARFTSKAALEDYLNSKTENKVWEKVKPAPDTNMNNFMAEHPQFIFEAQTRFALVKEMAQEFWDAFLEKLPGNTFSADQLVALIKAVGDEVYAARIAGEKDISVHFMVNMQTQVQTAGFLDVFLETKKNK